MLTELIIRLLEHFGIKEPKRIPPALARRVVTDRNYVSFLVSDMCRVLQQNNVLPPGLQIIYRTTTYRELLKIFKNYSEFDAKVNELKEMRRAEEIRRREAYLLARNIQNSTRALGTNRHQNGSNPLCSHVPAHACAKNCCKNCCPGPCPRHNR